MKVFFASEGGTTRKVAHRVASRLGSMEVVNVATLDGWSPDGTNDDFLLFSPTYGDSEFHPDFERFLMEIDWSAGRGSSFAFCELGIYTGYEDFGHGLAPMVHNHLARHGLCVLAPPLSLDSVPITDWHMVDSWADLIAEARRLRA